MSKAKIHYTSYPVASPQHKRQDRNKLAREMSVVSVVSYRFPNSITTTCCQLVANLLRTCCLRGSYGETCVMDFGHLNLLLFLFLLPRWQRSVVVSVLASINV